MTRRARVLWRVVLPIGLGAVQAAAGTPSTTAPGRVIHYSFTARNTGERVLSNAQVWVYAPLPRTAHQEERALEATLPYELIMDGRGNRVLHFVLPSLPPAGAQVIGVTALLGVRSEPLPEAAFSPADLQPEPRLEIDDPEFLERAPRFDGARSLDTAREIYNWTIRRLPGRDYVRGDLGALHALQTGEGDCTENAYLFAAMCRLHRIPARVLGGYRTRGGVLDPEQYHNWAEFHDGQTWRLADPHARLFDRGAPGYVAMRVVGGGGSPVDPFAQFRGEGDGLEVTMNRP